MKALAVWQPHASQIASGVKTIEYRSWSTHHRGDMLIIAAARVPRLKQHRHLPRGCAICLVRLVDVIEVEPGMFAWLLSDVRLVPSVPVRGRQRLWTI